MNTHGGTLLSSRPDIAPLIICVLDRLPNLQILNLNTHLSVMLNTDLLRTIEIHPKLSKVIYEGTLGLPGFPTLTTLSKLRSSEFTPLLSSKVLALRSIFCATTRTELEILQIFYDAGVQNYSLALANPKDESMFSDWYQLTIPGLKHLSLSRLPSNDSSDTSAAIRSFIDRHPMLLLITITSFPAAAEMPLIHFSLCPALGKLLRCYEKFSWEVEDATFSRELGGSFACTSLSIGSGWSAKSKEADFGELSEACPELKTLYVNFRHPGTSAWVLNDSAVSMVNLHEIYPSQVN